MNTRYLALSLLSLLTFTGGCRKTGTGSEVVKAFPLDNMDGIITRSNVTFDRTVSSDGNGSLRIDGSGPLTVRLFEVRGVDAENTRLVYRAHIRTENVEGQAYLEMWCSFPGLGEFFSRSLESPVTGTADWSTQETPFILGKDQKPELVKLNVVLTGRGRVWVDDIALLKGQ